MERRLGRGLGSLLGQSQAPQGATGESDLSAKRPLEERAATDSGLAARPQGLAPDVKAGVEAGPSEPGIGRLVDVAAIRRNPDQPRKTFASEALEELRQSIQRHGVLQPICLRRVEQGYEIVSGERRWRAARSAGLKTIPAVVREDVSDDVSLELAIVENIQRQELDALEKARGYQALMERFDLTQEQVAERVGLKRSSVTNQLRLLDLPHDAQEALSTGLISMGHARALLSLKDESSILGALAKVVRGELSVRETEALARPTATASASKAIPESSEAKPVSAPWVKEMETRIREALGVKVTLRNGKHFKGSITLDYGTRDDLERICDLIAPKPTV